MGHPILRVHLSSEFEKSFQKIPNEIKRLADKKDLWFRKDAFDKRLHTHKLKGELEGYWSYYINLKYRILFQFINSPNEVIYYDIGTHEIYR